MMPDLSAMFGPQPELSPEDAEAMAAHQKQLAAYDLALQKEMIERTAFFTPILCACTRRYDPEDASPPSSNCYVHGNLLEYNGEVFLR
jgi:hypothetical protein